MVSIECICSCIKYINLKPPHEPVPATYPEERPPDSNVFEDTVQNGSPDDEVVQPVETPDANEKEAEPETPQEPEPEPEPEPESGKIGVCIYYRLEWRQY